jgi:hypothetical protein
MDEFFSTWMKKGILKIEKNGWMKDFTSKLWMKISSLG